jgi:large subunit ribosomal protein L24
MSVQSHVKKGDIVVAISGRSKGKSGKVLTVLKSRQYALVEGVNLGKKAVKRSQQKPEGGIVDREMKIHVSKLRVTEAASAKKEAATAKKEAAE